MLHVCLPFLNISSLVILVKVPSRILLTEHCESKQFCFVFSPFELRIVVLIVLVLIISCCRNSCALTVCYEEMHYGMLLSILSLIPVFSFLISQLIL